MNQLSRRLPREIRLHFRRPVRNLHQRRRTLGTRQRERTQKDEPLSIGHDVVIHGAAVRHEDSGVKQRHLCAEGERGALNTAALMSIFAPF